MKTLLWIAAAGLVPVFGTGHLARAADESAPLSFNRDVQPLLAEFCYHCHGPDAGSREPRHNPLRFDLRDFALEPREDGEAVILPGRGADSEFVKRMRSEDPAELMPPPKLNKPLSEEQIAILERWIDEGAVYEPHWAFLKPERPPVPDVPEAGDWAANPIDAFLWQEMQNAGLEPNPPEEPGRVFRRLSLDMRGLPPTTDELAGFLANPGADAWDAAIEGFFETTAYAEHMARHWLDAARYADTHGIHIDNYRAIWPYRDWVIEAFADNMPFDQFSIEQLAGDLLPEPKLEQIIATGFNRCLPTTGEGGAIDEEYEVIYATDRVETTSGVWLGLTMACAACHDHKFDPITAEDFYAFSAFFRNTTMAAMDGNRADHPPNVFAPRTEDRQRWADLPSEIAEAEARLADRADAAMPDLLEWLSGMDLEGERVADSEFVVHLDWQDGEGPGFVLPGGDGVVPAEAAEVAQAGVDGGGPFSFGLFLKKGGDARGAVVARMDPGAEHRGWDIWLQDGRVAAHFIHSWPDKTLKIVAEEPLENDRWVHVWVNFEGSDKEGARASLFLDGVEVAVQYERDSLQGGIAPDVPLRIGAREPTRPGPQSVAAGSASIQGFRLIDRLLEPGEVLALAYGGDVPVADDGAPDQLPDRMLPYFLAQVDAAARQMREELADLEEERAAIEAGGSVTLVMEERADSDPVAHFLERGEYSLPTHEVPANVPSSLPPLPEGVRADRLAMAKWIFDLENPLPARVAVNRLWTQVFGTGLVETTEDFGLMGDRPSHPELLDWLAMEFIESGWDQRHILQLMFRSQAYRQSGAWKPEKTEIDPDNRLLSRGPRLRVDAEVLRDMALRASGLLVDQVGGPPVRPYQPEGIWEAVAMPQSNTRVYEQDEGDALYRRSLYTFWKRTAPHPAMEIFDAPSRELFCTRRERSNTPLQALVLMNDPQFVEACRVLAETVVETMPNEETRLNEVCLRLLSRLPTADESAILLSSLEDFAAMFAEDPASALLLLDVGDRPAAPNLDAVSVAAWTLVVSQILNTDEFVTR